MKPLTPMLKQYMEIKQNTKDALVFYRLGDFYELFYEDAITASNVLDLVLTARAAGNNEKAPMCGVPYHAARNYIQKLVSQGYKVAIVEQVEDPRSAKGIVRREVVEIVTPGTYLDMEDHDTREIAAIEANGVYATLVSSNLVSGSLRAIRIMNDPFEILKTLQQFQVKEIVVAETFSPDTLQELKNKTDIIVSFETEIKEAIELKQEDPFMQLALGRLIHYLEYTQKRQLTHLQPLEILNDQAYLRMDYATMTNLELLQHGQQKQLSLYNTMNKTRTAMGARALKVLMMQPHVDLEKIQQQHQEIDFLIHDLILMDNVSSTLKESYDIHKILARITTGKHNTHDFIRLNKSLQAFKALQMLLENSIFTKVVAQDPLEPVVETLERVIRADAPALLKEGNTFNQGVNAELDELLELSQNGKAWLLNYEQEQREKTGIKNLKISYTRAFGYYIEITKGQLENVKDTFGYIRKQTLKTAERYVSEELQNYELKMEQSTERILELEQELFERYTAYILEYSQGIHQIGDIMATLDVALNLAEIALQPGYTKPHFNHDNRLDIRAGRHPVLEATLQDHQYIASDVVMNEKRQILVLTGPNMGGKSTYMRMLAINVIMAQMGSYLPCDHADIELVDQIFTRMGASDDILLGQSTFMVEMMEAQLALAKATAKSLILFDEIGRGTSTYDGMALAQAIIEYIRYEIGAKTVFSTHYHELVSLEAMHEGIKNITVQVHEENDHVTFLYHIQDGRADKSYGINVARLAHLPQSVIERAKENLVLLEANKQELAEGQVVHITSEPKGYTRLKQALEPLDINTLKPVEALLVLENLKEMLTDDNH